MPRDLRSVLDAVLDGIVVVGADGRVETLNAEACRILGTSSEHAAARPLADLPAGKHLVRVAGPALREAISAAENELTVQRDLAEPLVIDAAAAPLWDGERPDGAVVVLRDRTLGTALRDLVSERERLADFGRIASGIAHELKNPLGGIRGAAELLVGRSHDAKQRATAEMIVREVDRITTLVDDLNTLSRGEALRLAPVNLHRVLDDVLDLLAMDPLGTSAKLLRRFDPSLPELLADADRLAQVFLNLGRNALEAMESEGGTLEIVTRVTHGRRVEPSQGRGRAGVLIEFVDEGSGIASDLLPQVTTPFVTTKVRGSGLGLALVQHFVALHGGTFRISSQPGRGTRASVMLPLRRPS